MISPTPSARAARSIRSNARATSGRIALALPRGERAGVAAARRRELAGRRELRLGDRLDRRRAARGAGADLEHVAHRHPHADGRERRAVGERHADARGAVGSRDPQRRRSAEREVLRLAEMVRPGPLAVGEHRLEQPRVGVVHRPGGGERAEVRRPLRPRLPAAAAGDEPEHQRPEDDRDEPADDEHRGLPVLGGKRRRRPARVSGSRTRARAARCRGVEQPSLASARHAGALKRPHPARAVVRAPGVERGPRTVSGTPHSASPCRTSSVSRASSSGGTTSTS